MCHQILRKHAKLEYYVFWQQCLSQYFLLWNLCYGLCVGINCPFWQPGRVARYTCKNTNPARYSCSTAMEAANKRIGSTEIDKKPWHVSNSCLTRDVTNSGSILEIYLKDGESLEPYCFSMQNQPLCVCLDFRRPSLRHIKLTNSNVNCLHSFNTDRQTYITNSGLSAYTDQVWASISGLHDQIWIVIVISLIQRFRPIRVQFLVAVAL